MEHFISWSWKGSFYPLKQSRANACSMILLCTQKAPFLLTLVVATMRIFIPSYKPIQYGKNTKKVSFCKLSNKSPFFEAPVKSKFSKTESREITMAWNHNFTKSQFCKFAISWTHIVVNLQSYEIIISWNRNVRKSQFCKFTMSKNHNLVRSQFREITISWNHNFVKSQFR